MGWLAEIGVGRSCSVCLLADNKTPGIRWAYPRSFISTFWNAHKKGAYLLTVYKRNI